MMDTQVSHLCKPVSSIDMDTSVQQILDNTNWNKITSIVVLEKDRKVLGIISKKDMVYAESLGIKKSDIKAWQICSKNIISINPEDSVSGAAHLMVDNKVSQVLVMTGEYVEGIVTSLDVIKELISTG